MKTKDFEFTFTRLGSSFQIIPTFGVSWDFFEKWHDPRENKTYIGKHIWVYFTFAVWVFQLDLFLELQLASSVEQKPTMVCKDIQYDNAYYIDNLQDFNRVYSILENIGYSFHFDYKADIEENYEDGMRWYNDKFVLYTKRYIYENHPEKKEIHIARYIPNIKLP